MSDDITEQQVRNYNRCVEGELIEAHAQLADLQSQFTQRTAEVEAAKAEVQKWEEIASLRFAGDHKFVKEMEWLKAENAKLHAELERVRGERDAAQAELAKICEVVQQLLKVEGEITVVADVMSARWVIDKVKIDRDIEFASEQEAEAYTALLKIRREML